MSKQYQKQKEKWKEEGYQLAKKEIKDKIEKRIEKLPIDDEAGEVCLNISELKKELLGGL